MSSVVLQQHTNCLAMIDEIVLERATTDEACQEFEDRYKRYAGTLTVFGDASGRSLRTTGLSDYLMLQNFCIARVPKCAAKSAG